MTNKELFSRRQELYSLKEKEITIREDAPEGLRGFIKWLIINFKNIHLI